MSFRIEPSQSSAIAAQAGATVGTAQKAKMEFEAQQQEQHDAAQFQQSLELHRIQQADAAAAALRQLDKEKHMALVRDQADIERFKEAQKWDIEKMRLRSEHDFAMEEKRRDREQAELEAGAKAIRESKMSDPDKETAMFNLQMRHFGGVAAPKAPQAMNPTQALTALQRAAGYQAPAADLIQDLDSRGEPLPFDPATEASPLVQAWIATARGGQAGGATPPFAPQTQEREPKAQPTALELRKLNTPEAFARGVALGYWSNE